MVCFRVIKATYTLLLIKNVNGQLLRTDNPSQCLYTENIQKNYKLNLINQQLSGFTH